MDAYVIVQSEVIEKLQTMVNDLIAIGYECQGGVQVTHAGFIEAGPCEGQSMTTFYQAMVLKP